MFPWGHRLAPIKHLTNSVSSIGGYLASTWDNIVWNAPHCILALNNIGDASIDRHLQQVQLRHKHLNNHYKIYNLIKSVWL